MAELILFAASWTLFAAIFFWLFSRLRGLRVLENRVADLEDAVYGFKDDCELCSPDLEDSEEAPAEESEESAEAPVEESEPAPQVKD